MAKLSLFRGSGSEVAQREVTDGQLLVDLTNRSLSTDVGNSRISLSSSRSVSEQSDWNSTDISSVSYIQNKPTKLSQFDSTYVIYSDNEPTTNLVNNKTRWYGSYNRVTVTFLNMDGITYQTMKKHSGDPFPTIEDPTLPGYTFDHWTPSLPSVVPNSNTTYTAVGITEVTLTFTAYDGSTYMTVTGTPGDSFPTIPDPTHTNSRFLGWNPSLPSVIPSSDTTYTSNWLDAVTLTFLDYDGLTYRTETVYPGDSFPTITNPTHTTYYESWVDPSSVVDRFDGWSPSLPSVVPNQNTTYASVWSNKVIVVFRAMRNNPETTVVEYYDWKTIAGYEGDSFPSPGTPPSAVGGGSWTGAWSPSLPSVIPDRLYDWTPKIYYEAQYR